MAAENVLDIDHNDTELLHLLMQQDRTNDSSLKDSIEIGKPPVEDTSCVTMPEALMKATDEASAEFLDESAATTADVLVGPGKLAQAHSDNGTQPQGPLTSEIVQSDLESDSIVQPKPRSFRDEGTGIVDGPLPHTSIEILLPMMPAEEKEKFESVWSEVVEEVLEETFSKTGEKSYVVQFTDGRIETVSSKPFLFLIGPTIWKRTAKSLPPWPGHSSLGHCHPI